MEIETCQKCGAVFNPKILQELNKDLSVDKQEDYRYYFYKSYYDFVHYRCPNCKEITQIN